VAIRALSAGRRPKASQEGTRGPPLTVNDYGDLTVRRLGREMC
jgi:hypothetical protein